MTEEYPGDHARQVMAEPASITGTIKMLYIQCRESEAEIRRKMYTNQGRVSIAFIKDFWPTFAQLYNSTEPFLDEGDVSLFSGDMERLDAQIIEASPDVMGMHVNIEFWPVIADALGVFRKYARLLASHNIISMQ